MIKKYYLRILYIESCPRFRRWTDYRNENISFFLHMSRSWSGVKSREKWKTRGRRGNRNDDYSNRLTFRRPTLCFTVQQFSYLGQARWHGPWLYSSPCYSATIVNDRAESKGRYRAKIGSTKREKKSVRFLLNVGRSEIARNTGMEEGTRRREINPRTKFEFPNDFQR